eukprot:Skav227496  [mRNA]  locus=scaffold282:137940:143275:+ [translate_table: standard]
MVRTQQLKLRGPAEVNSEETFSTLQYAKRAKTIRVAATRNKESKQREELQKEVEELRKFALEVQARRALGHEDKQRLSKEHAEQRELARKEARAGPTTDQGWSFVALGTDRGELCHDWPERLEQVRMHEAAMEMKRRKQLEKECRQRARSEKESLGPESGSCAAAALLCC